MAGIYGADVAQLRALGKALTASSARLMSTRTALSNDVRNATRWKGPDAERFRRDWEATHNALLAKVIRALEEAGHAAARHADEQERASGARGTAGSTSASVPGAGKAAQSAGFPGQDHSVPRHADRGEPNLTSADLGRLRAMANAAASGGNFLAGNDADVNRLREALTALKPAQLDQLLATKSATPDSERLSKNVTEVVNACLKREMPKG